MSVSPNGVHKTAFDGLPLKSIREKKGYHWYVVGTVCIGAFMAALDASIINIALPTMKRDFAVPMHIVEWVSLVYLLTLAALIVPFGRLADMLGRRWMYSIGFSVFIVGSLLCGISPSMSFLLGSRVLQAVGAAMLQANSVSIITAATPASDRGKAIGIQASAQGIGLSLGPAVGGALISLLNWRWIFFVNLPVGVIGTTLGILFLPKDEKPTQREHFDLAGAIILAPALIALIYFLNMGLKSGWGSPVMIATYVIFLVCMIVFLRLEAKRKAPMVDLRLFRDWTFSIGNLTGILSFAVMYAVLFLSPFYLDNVQRMNSLAAGLYLTVIPIGMTLLTPVSGMVADKWGTRLPTMMGMIAVALGCAALMTLGAKFAVLPLIVGLFLVGAGLGIFTPPNNSSVMGSAPNNKLGVAGGILNMSRTLGMGLGVTLGGLCYQLFLTIEGVANENKASVAHMVMAFRMSFITVGCVALVTFLLVSIRPGRTNQQGGGATPKVLDL